MSTKFEFELLPINDADAIIIRHFINDKPHIIIIDAGNQGDGVKIKNHLKTYYRTSHIDLAICTHPDKDHKDGFFDLLTDNAISIEQLWLTDPAAYLNEEDLKRYTTADSAKKAVRKIWNKSNDDTLNLIDLAEKKRVRVRSVYDGMRDEKLPLDVVGPTKAYYQEVVKEMVDKYNVKTYEKSEKEKFDAAFQISEEEAGSSIDAVEDDSPYNASSLIILYQPSNKKLLFAGDANTTSLQMMLKNHPDIKEIDFLKVPHHGSKHNLNTKIIDTLAPKTSYISSSGTRKHPSRGIVFWLSKYGDVYSTHQCSGYLHHGHPDIPKRGDSIIIDPLKKKK